MGSGGSKEQTAKPKLNDYNANRGQQWQVFISYQWDKQARVKVLYDKLTREGLTCWMDIHQMDAGDMLFERIADGVSNSQVVLLCLTNKYLESDNCKKESSYSLALKKPIIPLKLDKSLPWPLPGELGLATSSLLYKDFTIPSEDVQVTWNCAAYSDLVKQITKAIDGQQKKTQTKQGLTLSSKSANKLTCKIARVPVIGCPTAGNFVRDITIERWKNQLNILSLTNGQMLLASLGADELFVYLTDGSFVSTIELPSGNNEGLVDAAWTAKGNIVCAMGDKKSVLLLSPNGDLMSKTKLNHPLSVDVSADGVIALADWETGVYQSTDDGTTWTHVIKSAAGKTAWHVIRVPVDTHVVHWWVLEYDDNERFDDAIKRRLRVYTTDTRNKTDVDKVPCREVEFPEHLSITDKDGCRLVYDGQETIFMTLKSQRAVHTFSRVTGLYDRQLLSRKAFDSDNFLISIAVENPDDDGHVTLYIGQCWRGEIRTFLLTYKQ